MTASLRGCVVGGLPNPIIKVLALKALAFRGLSPAKGLITLLEHEDSRVREAALRCARFLSDQSVPAATLRSALASDDSTLRMAAIEVGLQHGWRMAWESCREVARAPGAGAEVWVLLALKSYR